MSRNPGPSQRTERRTIKKSIPLPGTSNTGTIPKTKSSSWAKINPAKDDGMEPASRLQKKVFKDVLSQSAAKPGTKFKSVGQSQSKVAAPMIKTKRGMERVVQQMKMETTVQRTPKAEYISKTITGVDVDKTGEARKLELTSQQIDPEYATESAGINLTVTKSSTLSITDKGKVMKKQTKKRTIKSDTIASKLNVNMHQISRLVREETEDVENTLKLVPPELVSTDVEKFPIKKRVQSLRLSSEPVGLLSESIVNPVPTADEVDAESPPEVLAQVMDAIEQGAVPSAAPNQIFHSLFPETEEQRMDISSVAPGPLEDVVVPTAKPPRLIDEVLTEEMSAFLETSIENKMQLPADDIASESKIQPILETKELPPAPKILEDELPPWEDATVVKLSSLVGAVPIGFLDTSDFSEMHSPADISQELSKGIDYFIDADVHAYETKIQIRGSKLPKWFPGYMYALPHLPELVKLSRSPSEVLHAAWKAVQPQIFPEDSVLIS